MFKLLGFAFRAAIIEVLAIGGLIWYVTSSTGTDDSGEPAASVTDLTEIGHDIQAIAERLTGTLLADESESRETDEAKSVPQSKPTVDPATQPRRLLVNKPQAIPTERPAAAPLVEEPVVDPQVKPGLLVVSEERPALRPVDEAVAAVSEPRAPAASDMSVTAPTVTEPRAASAPSNVSVAAPVTKETVPFPRSRTRGWR